MRPDTCIDAQKTELKGVGVSVEARTWSGAGVSVLVCKTGSRV